MAFPFLTIVMIIICLLALGRKRSAEAEARRNEDFINREATANSTRKQDISTLDYITIPLTTFPLNIEKDDQLSQCEQVLNDLSEQRILNLTGISNTDLKLQYGVANLPLLTEYDDNFTLLSRTLVDYATRLIELGHEPEAVTVLEFGISCKTDIFSNYNLLANLYQQQNTPEKISQLVTVAEGLTSLRKNNILECLANF